MVLRPNSPVSCFYLHISTYKNKFEWQHRLLLHICIKCHLGPCLSQGQPFSREYLLFCVCPCIYEEEKHANNAAMHFNNFFNKNNLIDCVSSRFE